MPDSRAMRFFDPEARVGRLYSSILQLPLGLPAWDVYLVFGPEVRWEGRPPAPAYWMHQLGKAGPAELRLDGERLALVVSGLLSKSGTQSRPAAQSPNQKERCTIGESAPTTSYALPRNRKMRSMMRMMTTMSSRTNARP